MGYMLLQFVNGFSAIFFNNLAKVLTIVFGTLMRPNADMISHFSYIWNTYVVGYIRFTCSLLRYSAKIPNDVFMLIMFTTSAAIDSFLIYSGFKVAYNIFKIYRGTN